MVCPGVNGPLQAPTYQLLHSSVLSFHMSRLGTNQSDSTGMEGNENASTILDSLRLLTLMLF